MFAMWKYLHHFHRAVWDSESVGEYDCKEGEEAEELSIGTGMLRDLVRTLLCSESTAMWSSPTTALTHSAP